ncbi:hypothetical protein ACWF62_00340, partial [Rhodococcus sp. NPDC054953]
MKTAAAVLAASAISLALVGCTSSNDDESTTTTTTGNALDRAFGGGVSAATGRQGVVSSVGGGAWRGGFSAWYEGGELSGGG